MSNSKSDRRRTRRRQVEEHGIVSARIRPGRDVSLLDVSAGGALIEGAAQLRPGARVELHLESPERRVAIRGHVVRCAVSRLRSTSVCYRGAISFDRHLPWFVDEESAGYPVPTAEIRAAGPGWADVTRHLL